MTQTHWTLAETLRRHGQKVSALARASGLSKNTVYDIVNGKTQAVTLETLDKLMIGLEQLTGASVTVGDVIGRDAPDPYAHLFVNAKPYGGYTPPDDLWTDEERAGDDLYWAQRDAEKRERLAAPDHRTQQLAEIFGDGQNDAPDNATPEDMDKTA